MALSQRTSIVQKTPHGTSLVVSIIVLAESSSTLSNFTIIDGVELMFVGIGFIAVPAVVLSYIRINKQRDAALREALEKREKNKYTDKELRELGDRAPDFRYTL